MNFSNKVIKKKYLLIFLKLSSYLGQSNKIKQIFSYKYLYFYRYNYGLINLSLKLLNLKFFFNFFKRLVFLNTRFFFVSTNLEFSKLIFFYTKKLNQFCFVGDWVPGLVTNLNERFNNVFFKELKNSNSISENKFYLGDKLLNNREVHLFKNKNYKKLNKKIDLLFFIGSENNLTDFNILKECFKLKLPVIGYFNSNFKFEYSPYFLVTNVTNFFNIYFFFLVIVRYYLFLQKKYFSFGKINFKQSKQKVLRSNIFRIKKVKKLRKF